MLDLDASSYDQVVKALLDTWRKRHELPDLEYGHVS